MRVRTNADTPEDARKAREFGAEGIGLCRTEHMFWRRGPPSARAGHDHGRRTREISSPPSHAAPFQIDDFVGIFEAMEGLPVTIRLLDPPLHEFLPDYTDLRIRMARAEATGRGGPRGRPQLPRVERLKEVNPMLGTRGCRLGSRSRTCTGCRSPRS